ncbi:MAG: hypothetical protein K0S63_231 [Gammaproteobacteria bacterium]|jgi:predicted nucleotidyltransferase component of viral defense system|nr:hypothetical protein [Gammaproteobacteria bacterium]
MILKQEITAIARILKLLPTTVEKDYVLSWVLYGISQHPKLSKWLFKGGTCLKKCYFETYRFSEDLDFTVPSGAIYNKDEIKDALNEVANIVYEQVGINLKSREIEVEESINKNNKKTYTAKFTYVGPLNLPSRAQQRVKFDITDDEIILDSPDIREVFHFYSDAPSAPAKITCYSVNEILAEKTRAIYERQGRARDIYDVVNINRSFREYVDIKKARHSLKEKFKFKALAEPSVDSIFSKIDFGQLKANWEDQLKHQLPVLPPVKSFYEDLNAALSWWIEENPTEISLDSISDATDEKIMPRIHFPASPALQIATINKGIHNDIISHDYLDRIRYAARNRLCVEISYKQVTRLVEPYSLRQARTGNLLLYAYELEKENKRTGSIKAYKINEIENTQITQQVFMPRYIVEL